MYSSDSKLGMSVLYTHIWIVIYQVSSHGLHSEKYKYFATFTSHYFKRNLVYTHTGLIAGKRMRPPLQPELLQLQHSPLRRFMPKCLAAFAGCPSEIQANGRLQECHRHYLKLHSPPANVSYSMWQGRVIPASGVSLSNTQPQA